MLCGKTVWFWLRKTMATRAAPWTVRLWMCVALALGFVGCGPRLSAIFSVATVEVARTPVELHIGSSGHAVSGDERAAPGQKITVGDNAQAVLYHDVGARVLLDGTSEAEVTERGLRLQKGRVFVDAKTGGRIEIQADDKTLFAANAGFEVKKEKDRTQVAVVRGEVAFVGAERGVVHSGEQLVWNSGTPGQKVSPTVLWDDWTGGLAWPDPRVGHGAKGLGEVGARRPGNLGEARFPLSLNRLEVRVRIEEDLAVTTVEETFFNPAEATLEGLFRVRLPDDAILSRFAIDRRGNYVDGYVKERETARRDYESKVYEGSTHDPALLEWEAPGQYKARLYPLPPGSTRKVLYTYSQWLPLAGPGKSLRAYRFPMGAAAGAGAPVIQELHIEVDAKKANAEQVRSGLGATLSEDGKRVVLKRTDYVPSADLTVELVGQKRPDDVALVFHVPHEDPPRPGLHDAKREDPYVLIRALPAPPPNAQERAPLDLALLVDVSAATDATHLAMARTVVEAVLRRLGPQDRVVLLGADLDAHPVLVDQTGKAGSKGKAGQKPLPPPFVPAGPDATNQLLEQLGAAKTGGATDLGASISQAAALFAPDRPSAVLYVGDGKPTVGELAVKNLRDRLASLPQPVRLYAVGIGDDANLDLLSNVSEATAGQAYRVEDRAAAAESALKVITHLSRPVVSKLKFDVGTAVDRVYPRETVAVRAGEPMLILARLKKRLPSTISIEGVQSGQPFQRTYRLEGRSLENTSDLRLRWSAARLSHLLESGASVEEVAELGVRQNLITPYTSYYVPSEEEVSALEQAVPQIRAAGCSKSAPSFMGRAASSAEAPAPAAQAPASGEYQYRSAKNKSVSSSTAVSEGQMGKRDKGGPADDEKAASKAESKDTAAEPAVVAPMPATSAPPAPVEERAMPDELAKSVQPAKPSLIDGRSAAAADADSTGILGLSGTGAGGGGSGVGGLGLLGGDHGFARQKSRARRVAEVATGTPEVRGSLDKAIIRRIVTRHLNQVRACQSGGASGRVVLRFVIGVEGNVLSSAVQDSTVHNPAVENCLALAVRGWEFPKPRGGVVAVAYPLVLNGNGSRPDQSDDIAPAVAISTQGVTVVVGILTHRPKGCSAASMQPLEERRQLWRERLTGGVHKALEVFQDAISGCEVRRWGERRELLRAMLRSVGGPSGMVELHNRFSDEPDDQEFLRHAILGAVKSPRDLRVIYDGLGLGDEERVVLAQEVVAKAKSLPDRLLRLEELLAKWPGDLKLRILRMETEETLGDAESARRTAEQIRLDPYADAQARTAVGELFIRLGDETGARRAFSEIVEFAPEDPLARRRLGDLYRAHNWFDEAYRQYDTLVQLQPGDNSVLMLLAAAAAGAGKIEEALGLEKRVVGDAEPGSETGLAKIALLWSSLRLAELRDQARSRPGDQAEELALLGLRARQNGIEGLYRPVRVFLTWAHPEADLELRVGEPTETLGPAMDLAPQFGLIGWHSHKDASPKTELAIEVQRQDRARAIGYDAVLTVVVSEGQKDEKLFRNTFRFAGELTQRRLLLRDGRLLPQ